MNLPCSPECFSRSPLRIAATARPMWALTLAATAVLALAVPATASAASDFVDPQFRLQSSLISVHFVDEPAQTIAFSGRDDTAAPFLGLVRWSGDGPELRRVVLPEDTVAVDAGPWGAEREALFILTTTEVLRVDGFASAPVSVVQVESVYRGTSLAGIGSGLDFARDIDGDDVAELVIPDFDVLRVVDDADVQELAFSSRRRGYGLEATYETTNIKLASGFGSHRLHIILGNRLLTFEKGRFEPVESELPLGLTDELLREKYYRGDDDVDQADITLREVGEFADISGDGIADVTTLETVSTGVFDKSTIYRVHLGAVDDGRLRFRADADLTLSSEGYQVGTGVAELGDGRRLLVSSSVKVGIGAVIGALFSRAVTLRTEIHPLGAAGAQVEPTNIKSRIRFDFDSGRAAFPTIKFGDIDGDGVSDLLLKTRAQRFVWRAGDTAGQFSATQRDLDLPAPADGDDVVLADLTGDGRSEIVAYYGSADPEEQTGRIGVFKPIIE